MSVLEDLVKWFGKYNKEALGAEEEISKALGEEVGGKNEKYNDKESGRKFPRVSFLQVIVPYGAAAQKRGRNDLLGTN